MAAFLSALLPLLVTVPSLSQSQGLPGSERPLLNSQPALTLASTLDRMLGQAPGSVQASYLSQAEASVERGAYEPIEKRALKARLQLLKTRQSDKACRELPAYALRFSSSAATAAREVECVAAQGKAASDPQTAVPLLGLRLAALKRGVDPKLPKDQREALLARLEAVRAQLISLAPQTELRIGAKDEDKKDERKPAPVFAGAPGTGPAAAAGGSAYPSALPNGLLRSRAVPAPVTTPEGMTLQMVSPHVARAQDSQGRSQLLAASVDQILHAGTPKEREAASWQTANEVVAALGGGDAGQGRAKAIHHWLYEASTRQGGVEGSQTRLLFSEQGGLALVTKLPSGATRIEQAHFGEATSYNGKGGQALVLTRPTRIGPDGAVQADPRRWKEYLVDGSVREWRTTSEAKKSGFFATSKTIETTYLDSVVCSGDLSSGRCSRAGSEKKASSIHEVPGSSTIGRIGKSVNDIPVVGHILRGGEWVGKSLYTGVVSGGQEIVYAVSGSDTYGLEAAGGYANNPAMRRFMSDDGYLSRLSRAQLAEVEAKAHQNRVAALAQAGFTRETVDAPVYQRMLSAPVSKEELMDALRCYGAGTYGKRLLEEAQDQKGWSKAGYTAGGVLMHVTEGAGEYLLNPVVWASFGLGDAVGALQGAQAAGTGIGMVSAGAVPTALTATRAAYYLTNAALYTPWIAGATENAANLHHTWRHGTEQESWSKTAEALSDLIWIFAP